MAEAKRTFVTLDGLRGIAALCIVVLHCYRYFGDFTWTSAALAVDLFFVLSGFVLAFAYERRFETSMTTREFIVARIIRLYPLYLVGIALGIVEALSVILLEDGAAGGVRWDWTTFWTSLPFALVMLPAVGQDTLFPFNGVMWSIFFELFINIVWAIFWKPLRSNRLLLIVILLSALGLIASVAFWQTMWLGASWRTFVGGLFRVSYSFFLGVLIFRIHQSYRFPRLHPTILLVGLPVVLFLPMGLEWRLLTALLVLPWFVLLGAQVHPQGLLSGICHQLGAASYAVYTVHKRLYLLTYGAVLSFLNFDLQLFAPWVGLVFAFGLVVGCLLLNRYFDEPARRFLTAHVSRRLRKAAEAEPVTQAP